MLTLFVKETESKAKQGVWSRGPTSRPTVKWLWHPDVPDVSAPHVDDHEECVQTQALWWYIITSGWWFGCHFLNFPIYWEFHRPNWRSYFSEGWRKTTNQYIITWFEGIFMISPVWLTSPVLKRFPQQGSHPEILRGDLWWIVDMVWFENERDAKTLLISVHFSGPHCGYRTFQR